MEGTQTLRQHNEEEKHEVERLRQEAEASKKMQKLEQELGQPVFERKTRAVTLTEAGLLLQSRAQQILSIIEDTKAEISDDGESGTVRVGAIPTIAPFFLPDLLRQFSKEHPLPPQYIVV